MLSDPRQAIILRIIHICLPQIIRIDSFSWQGRLLTNGYEWSITTVVLYIDIHLTIIDELRSQFEFIFIYDIK